MPNLAANAAKLGMWVWDIVPNRVWMSEKCVELFGFTDDAEITTDRMTSRIHPDDRAACAVPWQDSLHPEDHYREQYRLLLPDGTLRWVTCNAHVERDMQKCPFRMLGIVIDITESHKLEEAAREVSGRFITAQEDERRRIARDLHDDMNQRLALLSVELELMGREPSGSNHLAPRLEGMAARVKELSSEIHKMSYDLHPAKLDQLGLVSACRSFCRDLSAQSGVTIEFSSENVGRRLPADVELCIYRVLQEACQNVIKHSGAKTAQVGLRRSNGKLVLAVSDSGKGFDVQTGRGNGGLGMLNMRERVWLVHGDLNITSQTGHGTKIEVFVPVDDKVTEGI